MQHKLERPGYTSFTVRQIQVWTWLVFSSDPNIQFQRLAPSRCFLEWTTFSVKPQKVTAGSTRLQNHNVVAKEMEVLSPKSCRLALQDDLTLLLLCLLLGSISVSESWDYYKSDFTFLRFWACIFEDELTASFLDSELVSNLPTLNLFHITKSLLSYIHWYSIYMEKIICKLILCKNVDLGLEWQLSG